MVSQIERGESSPTVSTLWNLTQALQVDFAGLLEGRAAPEIEVIRAEAAPTIDGRGQGVFDRYRYHNVQASVVLDVDKHWSLQAGTMGTLGGENALRERGLLFGVWRKV